MPSFILIQMLSAKYTYHILKEIINNECYLIIKIKLYNNSIIKNM